MEYELCVLRERALSSKKTRPCSDHQDYELEEGEIPAEPLSLVKRKSLAPSRRPRAYSSPSILAEYANGASGDQSEGEDATNITKLLQLNERLVVEALKRQQVLREEMSSLRNRIDALRTEKMRLASRLGRRRQRVFLPQIQPDEMFSQPSIHYCEPSSWICRDFSDEENDPVDVFITASLFIPQMVSLIEADYYVAIDSRCVQVPWCWTELTEDGCVDPQCQFLHFSQIKPMPARDFAEACLECLPDSLKCAFNKELRMCFGDASRQWTDANAIKAIANAYETVLGKFPYAISVSVEYPIEQSNVRISHRCLLDIEMNLLDNYSSTVLEEWYGAVVTGKIHDDRILSMFHILLTKGVVSSDCAIHRLVCEHYGPDLYARLPEYSPPENLLFTDPYLLSAFINCVPENDNRTGLATTERYFPDLAITIGWARLLAETISIEHAHDYLSKSLEALVRPWEDNAIISIFKEQLMSNHGIYTRWFLNYPHQYVLNLNKMPRVKSKCAEDLIQIAPTDADPFILKWLVKNT